MSEKVTVKWLGHSCFRIEKDGFSMILDPFEPGSVPGLMDINEEANAVYCSHEHHDHGYRDAVKIVDGPENPFSITEIHSYHDDQQGGLRGTNIIRIFESEGIKLVHYGDIGCSLKPEEIEMLYGADCVMMPVGGHFTVDAVQAAGLIAMTEPKVVIPMHYRSDKFGFDVISEVDDFLNICGRWVRWPSDTIEIGHETRHYTAVLTYGK